ncbi:hypothetical protein FA13DRAFT_1731975 [Coprinellus micaceus]|uniref:Uncharacterized protein n=1 Tax=Coprinellus micaceus TaxID=71717 RepID=A0A4Y7TDZ3_COPMI|nr:hypothetical protein FA13DRAFT_1731975 [Coprinellus micaceus]
MVPLLRPGARLCLQRHVQPSRLQQRGFGIYLKHLKDKVDDNYKRKGLKEERKDAVNELRTFMDHGSCIIVHAILLQRRCQLAESVATRVLSEPCLG